MLTVFFRCHVLKASNQVYLPTSYTVADRFFGLDRDRVKVQIIVQSKITNATGKCIEHLQHYFDALCCSVADTKSSESSAACHAREQSHHATRALPVADPFSPEIRHPYFRHSDFKKCGILFLYLRIASIIFLLRPQRI